MVWLFGGISFLFGLALFLFFQNSKKEMRDAFKALSFDLLEKNSRSFLDLAKLTLERYHEGAKSDIEGKQKALEASLLPLKETLSKLSEHQKELEKRREGAYATLSTQIEALMQSEKALRQETASLSRSLRSPNQRGSWGQLHLRRVVELAGMLNQCDFYEQKTVESGGRILRPDLVIHLPGGRQIAVDAKTPFDAYLESKETEQEEVEKRKLQEHAASLRKHMRDLSSREYWRQFSSAPEYVILFLPAESFFSAALQADPTLIEAGADQNILFATPTTLIAILRAVAHSWKQENFTKSAQEIARLGQELYERIGVLTEHWEKLGRHLGQSVDAYNQGVASLESRVLVTARKLKESGSLSKEITEPVPIDKELLAFKTREE